ncbi:Nicotinate phosphoribosyltransferase 1 [Citrus sinensis]|nr:Nicotinate phosphoribosyltransferase 1 [Citrus sinensis]
MEGKANGPSENQAGRSVSGPTNPMVTPLLNDLYQFTMAYAYWKAGKHDERAVFDLYFRKNPFGGEYTIFAGLEECIRFIANFKLTEEEITFVRDSLPGSCEDGFFDYLRGINCSDVEVHAITEGSVVFPKVPLLRVEGPVAVVQLLETPFVNLINYASLVTTNAARHRFVASKSKMLLEFGLRRAQGPDGGIGASKYCYIGGFDATRIPEFIEGDINSGCFNVAAGKLFGIPLRGTHSHAFVSSFMSPDEIIEKSLKSSDGSHTSEDFVSLVQTWLSKIQWSKSLHGIFGETNQSELAAFISYALAFPNNFLALVDTYDVMRSGVPNFCAVALALNDLGYKAVGIRLDSGDLAYLSCEARKFFRTIEKEFGVPDFEKMSITASNDLNEETLDALNKQDDIRQFVHFYDVRNIILHLDVLNVSAFSFFEMKGHEVDAFGIGTYLVTCYAQAALGCVFKLVEINKQPRIKLSEDVSKVSIPCKKRSYRLYGKEGYPLVDIMTGENEPPPKVGERILCRHPFNESKRAYVVPQKVEELLKCYWPGSSGGDYPMVFGDVQFLNKRREDLPTLKDTRERCIKQLEQMRPDHMRRLNPTPYKVSVSAKLYDFIHFLWLNEAPVGELQ